MLRVFIKGLCYKPLIDYDIFSLNSKDIIFKLKSHVRFGFKTDKRSGSMECKNIIRKNRININTLLHILCSP